MSLSRLEWVVYKIESEIAISSSSERAQVVGQLRSVELDQPFRTQNNPDHSIRPVVSISNLDRSRQTYHATQIHWNIRLQAHPDRCQPGRPRSRPRLVEERRRRGHRAPSWTADLPPTTNTNETAHPPGLTTWTYNPVWPMRGEKQRALGPIASSRQVSRITLLYTLYTKWP
jgi:hypothetical protein